MPDSRPDERALRLSGARATLSADAYWGAMAEVERRIYFYKVEMRAGEWKRADVLRGLQQLTGEDQVLDLGSDTYAWALIDRVPTTSQTGRLRFFRDRRSNLPALSHRGRVSDLAIPEDAGLAEPTHIVLAGDGLIAAEYNHFAPRIATDFSKLLRTKLDLDLSIKTFVQGSIVQQLERLEYITVFEASLQPMDGLVEALVDAGPFGEAAAALAQADVGRRVKLSLSSERHKDSFTANAKQFMRRMLPLGQQGHGPKVLRVEGFDPVPNDIEVVDLLKQRLLRREDFERPTARSKALDTSAAYRHIEEAITEVRATDLPMAALL